MKQIVEKYYREILDQLKSNRGSPSKFFGSDYGGGSSPSLNIPNPMMRKIAREFASKYQDLGLSKLLLLINLSNRGFYSTEKCFAGMLLQRYPKLMAKISPGCLDSWLDNLSGWSQVDSICQSVFSAQDMLSNWPA